MRTVPGGRAVWGGGTALAGLAVALAACAANEDVPADGTPAPSAVRVTVGGNTVDFPQGEAIGNGAVLIDGQPTVAAIFRTAAFDRCSGGAGLDASASRATMTAYLPPRVGRYTLPAGAVTFTNGSVMDTVRSGTLDITRVDGRTIEGSFDAVWTSVGSLPLQGTFAVDSCGLIATDVMTFTGCTLPTEPLIGPYTPRLYAVSPAGRVLLATSGLTATIYKRQVSGATCTYVADTTYGTAGTITFRTHYHQSAWDAAERLYVTSETGGGNNQEAGAFYRVTPGKPLESCTNNAPPVASVVDQFPDEMRVLPDGSRAFFYWRNLGEWTLDLADPSLGPRNLACNFVTVYDGVSRYTTAMSMSSAGLLFVQTVQGRMRAVETDALLSPLRIFGGSPSGKGEQGLQDARFLSRCPVGYCAIGDPPLTMKLFRADGTFIQMLRPRDVVSGFGFPSAFFFGPGTGGTAWLRVTTNEASSAPTQTVYQLSAKP